MTSPFRYRSSLTLRDARRLAARPGVLAFVENGRIQLCRDDEAARARVTIADVWDPGRDRYGPMSRLLAGRSGPLDLAAIDRLIGLLGPGYPRQMPAQKIDPDEVLNPRPETERPEGESRPKGTSEVAEATAQTSDSVHGGDGNSGEVEHAAQTSSSERREGSSSPEKGVTHHAPSAGMDGGNPEPTETEGIASQDEDLADCEAPPNEESRRAASAQEGEEPRDRATSEPGQPANQEATTEADDQGCDAPVGAGAADDLPDGQSGPESAEGGPVTSAPFQAKSVHGGTFDDATEAQMRSRADRRSAQEVARALKRLIQAIDLGGLDESPRIHGGRLVRELKSRRCALGRAVRREQEIPLILLLCDVSGSCSAVCTDTLAACLAVAESLPDARVLRHSNGELLDTEDRRPYGALPRRITDYVREQKRPVGAVVAFGDWDAGNEYQSLCESGARLVWLDSYCCRVTGVQEASRRPREPAQTWKRQPLAWFQGVSDARSAAIALRAATKRAKGDRR